MPADCGPKGPFFSLSMRTPRISPTLILKTKMNGTMTMPIMKTMGTLMHMTLETAMMIHLQLVRGESKALPMLPHPGQKFSKARQTGQQGGDHLTRGARHQGALRCSI